MIRRLVFLSLAVFVLAPALLGGSLLGSRSEAAAQSTCQETGSNLFLAWTQGGLPMDYYMLAPDAASGWVGDVVGFYGIPIYYPAGWSYQPMESGIGFYLAANDGTAAYVQDASINMSAGTTSEQAATQINGWLLGGSNGNVLCAASGMLDGDLPTQVTILSEEYGGYISLAYVFVIPNPSTGGAMVSYYAMAGPANSFDDLMVQTFLPMMNMYLRTHGAF